MKKIFGFAMVAAALSMTAVPAMGQNELVKKETVVTIKNGVADTVVNEVRTFPCGVPFSKKDANDPNTKSYFGLTPGTGLGIGFIAALNTPDDISTKMGRSVEVDWNILNVGYTFNNYNSVGVGFGLLWRNYRMTNDKFFDLMVNRNLRVEEYETVKDGDWSRLHSLAITVPVLYTHVFKKGWHVTAGAEFAFNCLKKKRYNTRTRYSVDNTEYTCRQNGVKFNPVNVNALAVVGYKNVSLYARYAPMDVLDTDYGPSFKSLSVGVRVNMIQTKRKINRK